MNLISALRVADGDVVAFVGGGGKTTAMFRLADEIVAAGRRVLTTTTTRIFAAQTSLAPVHIQSVNDLGSAFARSSHVLLTGAVDPLEGKAFGIPPETICGLQSSQTSGAEQGGQYSRLHSPIATILIEADGSRMRPFKAPADHEPVIPTCVSVVVPVVGIDAIGKPLNARYIHRPDLVASIYPGKTVTAEMVAAVLLHSQGGRKNVPAGARFMPLINKVENDEQRAAAERIAELLLPEPRIDRILVGAVAQHDNPILQVFDPR